MEGKPEKIKRVIPKMPMIEWFFYSAALLMAMTFTVISTFTTLIPLIVCSLIWLFTFMVLITHVIPSQNAQNDRILLPHTNKITAICFTAGLVVYWLTLISQYWILVSKNGL